MPQRSSLVARKKLHSNDTENYTELVANNLYAGRRPYSIMITCSGSERHFFSPVCLNWFRITDVSDYMHNTDLDGAIFALKNILQRLIVLQPFLTLDFPGINQVIYNVGNLVDELKEMEDEMHRSHHRSRGRPKIQITEHELLNLLELRFTQVEIASL